MLKWLQRVFGDGSGFSQIERAILLTFARTLDSGTRMAWLSRVEHITLVQRNPDGREVNCYDCRKGKVVFPPSDRLFESEGELVFGKVELSMSSGRNIVVQLWVVNGYFFSFEYSEPLKVSAMHAVREIKVLAGPNYVN